MTIAKPRVAVLGGGSSSRVSLVGGCLPGDLSLGPGVEVVAGFQTQGQVVASSVSGATISGNSITSTSTSKDGIKLDTCTNVVACGNVVVSGANIGNYGILSTGNTR